jgi:hypothetical protein
MFLSAANEAKYLENLSGIASLLSDTKIDDIIECGDDEDDF